MPGENWDAFHEDKAEFDAAMEEDSHEMSIDNEQHITGPEGTQRDSRISMLHPALLDEVPSESEVLRPAHQENTVNSYPPAMLLSSPSVTVSGGPSIQEQQNTGDTHLHPKRHSMPPPSDSLVLVHQARETYKQAAKMR